MKFDRQLSKLEQKLNSADDAKHIIEVVYVDGEGHETPAYSIRLLNGEIIKRVIPIASVNVDIDRLR